MSEQKTSQPSMIVRRLKNSKGGTYYNVETRKAENQEHAERIVNFWWASKGSMAVVIIRENGDTDSHYMREYCDPDRVPKKWMKYWEPPPKVEPKQLEPNPEPRAEPELTLFNEEPDPEPAKKHTLTYCACCGNNREPGGYGERDRTPSGRINDRRCPECGKPLRGMNQRQIQRLYLKFVSR